jgi:hypothetical protein
MRRLVWWLIVSLVLITSLSGLWNGFQDWASSENFGERMLNVAVIIYGIAGAILVFVLFAGTAAPYIYSDEAKWIGTVGSGICMIALLTLIGLRVRKEASSW